METPEPERSARERQGGDVARYSGLMDYLRVVRRHRLLIALITIGCAVAAFAYSQARPTTYEAEAQMSFDDPFQDLTIFNANVVPAGTAAVRAPTRPSW